MPIYLNIKYFPHYKKLTNLISLPWLRHSRIAKNIKKRNSSAPYYHSSGLNVYYCHYENAEHKKTSRVWEV